MKYTDSKKTNLSFLEYRWQKCHEDFVKYAFSHCNTEIILEARKIGCLLQLFCRVK